MDFIKQNFATVALALVAIALALGQGGGLGDDVSVSLDNQYDQTITVSGQAERLVAPDTASVSFSLTRKSKNLSEATDSVNQRVADMLDQLGEFGIKDKDIKTTNYSVYPEYTYPRNGGERTFNGYRVTQSLQLKIRDLDQVEPVMTAVAGMKLDNVSGLNFFVDDDQDIKDDLRAEAIADAKAKAKELEKQLGVDLDVIVGFHENTGGHYPQPVYASRASFDEEFAVADAAIPVGENKMQATVSVTYKISKD